MATTRRSRRLLIAASALLAGGLGVTTLSPSGATAPTGGGDAAVLKAPQPGKGKAWVQGTVQDRAGRAPLGVLVEAFEPGSPTPVASDLTYEGLNIHGDEVEGFYRLVVPAGEYVLKFSSPPGTADPFRAVRGATVDVSGREVRQVGTQTMTLQRKAKVTVTAELSSKQVRSNKRATVSFEVTSPDVDPVTGSVEVAGGRRTYGEVDLVRSDRGAVEIELPKLRPGIYKMVVSYAGNDYTAAGSSQTLKLTVKAAPRRR